MKATLAIKYTERLGDIIRCLPIALHYAAQGERVVFECKAQYHGIFDAVSYVTPTEHTCPLLRTLDLTIWPHRYAAFLASGQTWADFVYSLYDLEHVPRQVIFDRIDDAPEPRKHYGLPRDYCIVSPFGYSQRNQYPLGTILALAAERMGPAKIYILADGMQKMWLEANGWRGLRTVTAESPCHLPRLLRDAAAVMTTNSAPTHICAAVRDSYFHLPEHDAQNDLRSWNQIRVEI